MHVRLALALALVIALVLAPVPRPADAGGPLAEIVCAPRAEMRDRLARQHAATPQGMGMRDAEAVIELWTDPQGRWTLVQSYASGLACIVAMGTDWAQVRAGA
jgi:hypothetical protein